MTATPAEIESTIDQYDKEVKSIKENGLRMCWYMRGGLTYEQAMLLSHEERQSISALIKDNLETTKKTNLPFF